jgi:hypothetical protein
MLILVLASLIGLSNGEMTEICARWSTRRINGAEAYGLLKLKQLGPVPYSGATQADRMDAAVATIGRPRLSLPGT